MYTLTVEHHVLGCGVHLQQSAECGRGGDGDAQHTLLCSRPEEDQCPQHRRGMYVVVSSRAAFNGHSVKH